MIKKLIWIIVSAAWTSSAYAQCEALLKDGVFDFRSQLTEEERVSSFVNYMRDQVRTSSSSSTSVDAGIGVKILKANLKGDQQKLDQSFRDLTDYKKSDTEQRNRLITVARTVNEELARQFVKCQEVNGLHVWIEHTADPTTFKIATVNRDGSEKPRQAYIRSVSIVPGDVSCQPQLPKSTKDKPAAVGGSTVRSICTRSTCKPVTAVVNASVNPIGGGSLTVPSFCSVVDEDDGKPGNSKLCPAGSLEGRNVAVHYSAHNILLSDVQVGNALRSAGATVTPNEKPRSEVSNPKYIDYRIYYKNTDSAERFASRLKSCVSKIEKYRQAEVQVFSKGILDGPLAKYDAVIYAVEQ